MYAYTHDPETGGLLLNSSPLSFSKEPRPVYYKELDILGFDQYWKYAKNDAYPYLWAEANNYYYRGNLVAKTKGGSLYTAPEIEILEEPEPDGQPLRFVDVPAMVEKNRDLIEKLAADTIKKIYNTYMDYKDKVDVFYVAFSGGKDSVVALDLVQRTLPHNQFKVLFGDTGMEFPDTYDTVDVVETQCKKQNIEFVRAKSSLTPDVTWKKFGPPATVLRWCCSVHKTAPQVIALRELTGKNNFTGMAFIGVRASESIARSEYDYVSLGEKHKGQYSCNPILDWNSAELYTYIYSKKLYLNEAYKKGNRRAGCLVCPRATERNDFMARVWYPQEFDKFVDSIKSAYRQSFPSTIKLDVFISNGGWKARKNGRDIDIHLNYIESNKDNFNIIKIKNAKTPWKEWIKTIGILLNDENPYTILFRNERYSFCVTEENNTLEVMYEASLFRQNPLFVKLLKNTFRKAACCIGCRECEADCHNGCISMNNGHIHVSNDCIHCAQCHKVENGCLLYNSLEMPKGNIKMSETKSLNRYSHHAPKIEWITQYFSLKNNFDEKNTLGSQMYNFFRRFLRDAKLLDENGFTQTAEIVNSIGLYSDTAWAIMLTNLTYSTQINWMIKNMKLNETYDRCLTTEMLIRDGAKESWAGDVWQSMTRLVDLPFQVIGLGCPEKNKGKVISITRTPWQSPDPIVILYSLYKFAEACGGYYQFTLSRLLNHDVESDGVSPTEIFGLDRDQMEKLLTGLSINYPDYINASFTLDLDNITLYAEKSSQDVLSLF